MQRGVGNAVSGAFDRGNQWTCTRVDIIDIHWLNNIKLFQIFRVGFSSFKSSLGTRLSERIHRYLQIGLVKN